MRIIKYISDIHLERRFKPIVFSKKTLGGDIFIAGDIGSPLKKSYWSFMDYVAANFNRVFFVAGNHEYWNREGISINNMNTIIEDEIQKYNNVFFLNNNIYSTKHYDIIGTTLWSEPFNNLYNSIDFMNIYYDDNELMTPQSMRLLHNQNKLWLKKSIYRNNKPKIIMTHYLPSFKLTKKYKRFLKLQSLFASNMEDYFKPPVILWIHGHVHYNRIIKIKNIPCIVNAPGYYNKTRLKEFKLSKHKCI